MCCVTGSGLGYVVFVYVLERDVNVDLSVSRTHSFFLFFVQFSEHPVCARTCHTALCAKFQLKLDKTAGLETNLMFVVALFVMALSTDFHFDFFPITSS